ncbi:hypothetical protein [Pandoraea sp. ISTKB]|uniref:DUF7338 family protein n=1 Tax=Pandoraea sp. ISTKB TaxID=1586708 RepID=UPI000847C1FB|nr:hypothetical protein [Pandoraea sp. ISTKB]ODP33068.1 hypothetical protein A9762_20710 [Pandoraea sp. ISTKB]
MAVVAWDVLLWFMWWYAKVMGAALLFAVPGQVVSRFVRAPSHGVSTVVTRVVLLLAYPAHAALSLGVTLFAWSAVCWWAPLFVDRDGNLPKWLRWYQTFDASVDAGWSDAYYTGWLAETRIGRYISRVLWLCRNPAYGFDYALLGVAFAASEWRVVKYVETEDTALFFAVGRGFNFYYEGRWGRYKIGWKAWNRWGGTGWDAPNWAEYDRIPLCFTLNPFHRRPA